MGVKLKSARALVDYWLVFLLKSDSFKVDNNLLHVLIRFWAREDKRFLVSVSRGRPPATRGSSTVASTVVGTTGIIVVSVSIM